MKDGYQSVIAQGGTNLSGDKNSVWLWPGTDQKTRYLCPGRQFLALDFKTDARLRAALKKEIVDSTLIIVAQRVSTIMDADQIIVLDEGRIAGIGKHKELLKNCQVYYEIVSSQLSQEEIA